MTIDDIAAKLRERVAGSGFEKSVKIVLGDEGTIVLDGNEVSTTDAPADCTIRVTRSDFEDIVSGDLSPTSAFMTGKLKVEGDMSAAMALSSLL
jgi:putative sterol carrier protein